MRSADISFIGWGDSIPANARAETALSVFGSGTTGASTMAEDLREIASKLGIHLQQLGDVAVLVLPENSSRVESPQELYDADGSVLLAKHFKSVGVPCKTAYDLGLRPKVMDRRGADVWLGVLWFFLDNGLFPLAVNVMADWISARYLPSKGTSDRSTTDDTATIHVELGVQSKNKASTLKFDGSATNFLAVLSGLRELGNRPK